jgi:hypothetical protein
MSWVLPEELLLVPVGIALLALLLLAWCRAPRSSAAAQGLLFILAVIAVVGIAWVLLVWTRQ